MRRRKWVLVLAIILGIVIFSGYFGWRVTEANDKIKQILLARIRPFLAQESDIEKVEMDLSSLHLRGVRLAPKDRSFSVEIEDVRLGYRFWNLLKYRLAPHKVAHEVVLIRPAVIIRSVSTGGENGFGAEGWLDFSEVVKELESVKRITVSEAEVILEDSSGARVRLAHSLNGWLQASPTDSATVRLTGKLLESKSNNLMVDGKVNILSGKLVRMEVQIKESEPFLVLPFLLPGYIQVTAGRVRGEVHYDQKREASGFLEIRDGSFSFKEAKLTFEDVNVRGTLRGKAIHLEGTVQRFNGSPLEISGRMEDVFDPHLDLWVHCSRFDVPAFFRKAVPEVRLPLAGEGRFGFHFTGPLNNATMRGDFVSSNLRVYGVVFDRFRTRFGLRDSVLTFIGEGTQEGGLGLNLKGKMDFSDSRQMTSLAIDIGGSLMPSLSHRAKKRMERCGGDVGIRLEGGLKKLKGEAWGVLTVVSLEGDTLRFLPNLRYEDRKLFVEVGSNRKFQLDGEFRSPFQENVHWDIRAEGMTDFLAPMLNGKLRRAISKVAVAGHFSGSQKEWEIWAEGIDVERNGNPKVFEVKMNSERGQKKWRKVGVRGVYFGSEGGELPLFAQGMVVEKGVLLQRCEIGDFVSLEGFYPFRSEGDLAGNVKLSNFSLEKLHEIFPRTHPYSGRMRGGIRVAGTRSQPSIDSDLSLRDGQFHALGVFEGDLDCRWENRKFRSCSFSFRRNGTPLLVGEAERVEGDSLVGGFWGKDVNFGDLILAVTGRNVFRGTGDAEIRVGGSTEVPLIHGAVEVHDGSLGTVSFRELRAEVVDTLSRETDFLGGTLSIQKGLLDRDDGLKVLVWGDLTHGRERDSDVSVLAQGNILGFLPEVSEFFVKAKGSGEVFLRWAGRPGEWVLGSGRFRLDDGEVELAAFVKRIEKLRGKAELQQEKRFIRISSLSGEIAGERFSLTNKSGEEGVGRFVPLGISRLGVHLGVLELESSEKGIRVHLLGLMEDGEEGWLAFGGLESGESFTIAGPAEFPLLRGTLTLTDHRFTYPFLPVEGDSGVDRTLQFLKKVHWDLRAVPKKDVHYVRNIGSPLGNVYMDLKLMDGFGSLRFQGIIQERTFQVWGNLVSTEGHLDALDHYFRPERITFDYPRGAEDPIISGRTFTTVIDSMGMPSTVWLSLASVEDATGLEREGGPWSKIQFRFSTDNPNLGRTEADLMAALGYSVESIKDRAYDALGMRVENLVFRPIFRPLERGIRRHLGLDVVRLSSMFSRNIVQLRTADGVGFDPKFLLRSAKLTVGKYLAPGLFIIYAGQVQNGLGFRYLTHGLGFRHAVTLEYAIRPDLLLQMEYTYDSQLLSDRREDKRIWIRHVFPF